MRKLVNNLAMKGSVVNKPPQLKSGIHENKKKEDGLKQSQKLLLTWLIEDTRLFSKVSRFISPEDFTEELYQKVAATLFEQYKTQGTVNPAKIISSFMDEEEQKEVAGLFNARIHEVETQSEMEKALKETIIRVKENANQHRSAHTNPNDINAMMQMIEDRKALDELKKLHISLN